MTRPLRIEFPGAVYHLTSRGNRQEPIFVSDDDRCSFLEILGKTVSRYHWICHAYCLMDNHYHLLVETPEPNLSLGMRQLNGVYTQALNRTSGKVGHVFQGRFKSILVEKEAHLLELCRYIVLNPVRTSACTLPEEWEWSSYKATAGEKRSPQFLKTDWILSQFAPKKREARKRYRFFVAEGLGKEDSPLANVESQLLLGGKEFIEKMASLLSKKSNIKEISKLQRNLGRPALSEILPAGDITDKSRRNQAICKAHLEHGYRLNEIADYVGIHYSTVSKIVSIEKN